MNSRNDPASRSNTADALKNVYNIVWRRFIVAGSAATVVACLCVTARRGISAAETQKRDPLDDATSGIVGKIDELTNRVKTLESVPQMPLGAVVPYFGVQSPKGYRWCMGNEEKDFPRRDNVFPKNADWVPMQLRGQPLPDLRGELIGGAPDQRDEDKPARVWDEGKVEMKVFMKQQGSNEGLELPASPAAVGGATDVFFWRRGDSTPTALHADHDKGGERAQVVIGSINAPRSINGSFTVQLKDKTQLPRYVMCRWIIRVE